MKTYPYCWVYFKNCRVKFPDFTTLEEKDAFDSNLIVEEFKA